MASSVRSHSPQTHTYLQILKCMCFHHGWLRGRPGKRPILDQWVFPLHTTRLNQGPQQQGEKAHKTSKASRMTPKNRGSRMTSSWLKPEGIWGNRPGSCGRHYEFRSHTCGVVSLRVLRQKKKAMRIPSMTSML